MISRGMAVLAVALLLTGCSAPAATPVSESPAPSLVDADSEFLYQWDEGSGEAIWTMDASGAGDARIPLDGSPVHPDWSPDGERVVYALDRADGHREIWTAGADGSDPQSVVPCVDPCLSVDSPAWSPDGSRIAFSWYDASTTANGPPASGSIRTVDLATGQIQLVTQTPPASGDVPDMPRWSPTGDALVIEVDHFDELGAPSTYIATVPIAGGDPTPLTEPALMAQYPDWSPDGEMIVFCTYDISIFTTLAEGTASNLYTVAVDGSGLTQLTDFDGGERLTQPSWLRDGTGIVATLVHSDSRTGALLAVEGGDPSALGTTSATHVRERPHP